MNLKNFSTTRLPCLDQARAHAGRRARRAARQVFRAVAALPALALLGACATTRTASPPPYTDLSQAFVEFHDRTQGLDDAARLAAFKAEVAPLYPGFYAPRFGRTSEQQDRMTLNAIRRFPEIRDKYLAAQQAFPAAYAGAIAHFRQYFPDSTAALPTYFLHSLGEMDGGTRKIDGRSVMVFGADGIALYHTPQDIGPFFDHELFHVEHGSHLAECEPVWCSLWTEGLATAAAEAMNPGIDLRGLMLAIPRPIQPEIDADWRAALCLVRSRLDSTAREDYAEMFMGGGSAQGYPPRWGYYVGFRLAQRALRTHALTELAHMPGAQAEPLVRGELDAMIAEAGGC